MAERVKTITIALDNDNAGAAAAAKLKEKLLAEGFSVKVIFPSDVKDWNQALLAGMSKDEFLTLVENAAVHHPEEKPSFSVEELNGRYHFIINGILFRLSGVKDNFISNLRVNIRAEKEDLRHIDNVDLFSARSRSMFSITLGRLFGCESARIEKDLLTILAYLEDARDRKLFGAEETEIELSAEDKKLGMELLLDPELLNRIENDMSTLGYVGEPVNKLLMYLAASSRKLDDPVSIIVISQSAAGKSYLIDTVKKLIPPEDVISVTSLSDQALNYMPESALMHKFLSLGEAVHSDVIDHQMREMLSGHELSRLVTGKDEKSGKMESKIVKKKVIVSAVMSSTTSEINPENASRSFVISTDESEAQTKEIHKRQRQKYSFAAVGLKEDVVPGIIKAHHAAQRLLERRLIINPFAGLLDFPSALMRTRRDHERFIDLIACVCHLRQFQKEQKEHEGKTYIECDLDDYSFAYEIMIKILPQTMSNFPKSAELLYEGVRKVIEKKAAGDNLSVTEVSITQREIRENFGYEHNFVKRNMRALVEYEYLNQRGGRGRGGRAYYRLNSEGPITGFDLSTVPTPTQMKKWVKTGAENVVDLNVYREAN